MESTAERQTEYTVVDARVSTPDGDVVETDVGCTAHLTLDMNNQGVEDGKVCGKPSKSRDRKKKLQRKRGPKKFKNRAVTLENVFLSIARRKRGSSSQRSRRDVWGSLGNASQCTQGGRLNVVESIESTENFLNNGLTLPRIRLKVKFGRDDGEIIESNGVRPSESKLNPEECILEKDRFDSNIDCDNASVSEDVVGNKDSEGTEISTVCAVHLYNEAPGVPVVGKLIEKGGSDDAASPDSEVSNYVLDDQLKQRINGVTGTRDKPLKKRGEKLKSSVNSCAGEIAATSASGCGSTNSLSSKDFSKELITIQCEVDVSKAEEIAEVQTSDSIDGNMKVDHSSDPEFQVSTKCRGKKNLKKPDRGRKKRPVGRPSKSKNRKCDDTKKKGSQPKTTSRRKIKINKQDHNSVGDHDSDSSKEIINEAPTLNGNDCFPFADAVDQSLTASEITDQCSSTDNAWVRCDDCHKWRRISEDLADFIGQSNRHWSCRDNLNTLFADCSVPQEMSNSDINAELGISEEDAEPCDTFSYCLPSDSSQTVEPKEHEFVRILSNQFLHRNRKNQNIDEIMVCSCKRPMDGGVGCKDGCLNRMLNIECIPGTCPCGDLCSNQQFQQHSYAKMKWVRCGKKGFGLRLEEDISEGKFLIEYVGEVLDMRTYQTRLKEYASIGHKHFYFMTLDGSEVIDACAKGNLGRFINHSCDPNCRTEKWVVNGEICIGLFAIRDIKKDEELTFDYNFVRVVGAAAKQCYCGSPKCRGYIGGDPVNAEFVDQVDSDEEFPEPVMREEKFLKGKKAKSNSIDKEEMPNLAHIVDNLTTSSTLIGELENVTETDDSSPQSVATLYQPTDVLCVRDSREEIVEDEDVPEVASNKSKSPSTGVKRVFVKSRFYMKSSEESCVVKRGKVPSIHLSSRKSFENKPDPVAWKPKKLVETLTSTRFEAVEEKLNDLLDRDGGISKRRDAPRGYLQLLHLTAASGNGNGETIQSNRDLSLLLDAILKTRSRVVLNDIIQKNVMQKLHNMMKQCRRDFKKMPILRKVLKVLDFLALKEVLTLEHICKGPAHPGVESFIESMLSLTEHDDKQVHQIARNFRDKWIPRHARKICFLDREDERKNSSASPNMLPSDHNTLKKCNGGETAVSDNPTIQQSSRKRRTRWDQDNPVFVAAANTEPMNDSDISMQPEPKRRTIVDSEQVSQGKQLPDDEKENIIEDAPPGFSVKSSTICDVQPNVSDIVIGNPQKKFLSRLPVSYGFPLPTVQQFGLPVADEVDSWVIAPGMAFQPFPPLPSAPNPKKTAPSSIKTSTGGVDFVCEDAFRSLDNTSPSQCGPKRSRDCTNDLGTKYFKQQKWERPLPWMRNAGSSKDQCAPCLPKGEQPNDRRIGRSS